VKHGGHLALNIRKKSSGVPGFVQLGTRPHLRAPKWSFYDTKVALL